MRYAAATTEKTIITASRQAIQGVKAAVEAGKAGAVAAVDEAGARAKAHTDELKKILAENTQAAVLGSGEVAVLPNSGKVVCIVCCTYMETIKHSEGQKSKWLPL